MEKTNGYWTWVIWENSSIIRVVEKYCTIKWFIKREIIGDREKGGRVIWV